MTDPQDFYGAYREARSHNSLTEQVIMLYDGVINFVKQGKSAIEEQDWETRWNVLNRAIAIVNGLHEALDFDKGGEAGIALDRFYNDIDARLVHIQCHNQTELCDSVARDMKILRDVWADIARQERAGNALSSSAGAAAPQDGSDNDALADALKGLQLRI